VPLCVGPLYLSTGHTNSISLLVALGVRADGQKVLLAIRNMGGESEAAWRALLDNLVSRGLRTPKLVIVDGGSGLDKALAALWPDAPIQRGAVHKHRNMLAHAPERLHEEVSADYNDMIYAATPKEIETKRKTFVRKWRLKCKAVADSLEEAGDRLFTFTRFPPSQWKSIRTTNAIERLHEEFKRRIKTRPFCRARKPPPCCSGPRWLQVKSSCEKSMVGQPSPRSLPIRLLTSPHDPIISDRRRSPQANSTPMATPPGVPVEQAIRHANGTGYRALVASTFQQQSDLSEAIASFYHKTRMSR
jgi:hypothetical protein